MPRNIIMDDIAAMAGVTKSTVSRYFNGGSVKESTKQRIQEITREYNDEPYAFARLKARESNVVGVVVPRLPAGWSPASDGICGNRGMRPLLRIRTTALIWNLRIYRD